METSKKGFRKDLGCYMRSKMESNVARYYNFSGIKWLYETKEFEFPIKRGTRYYKPDFYLPCADVWVEVKGYFRSQDRTKLKRFKKYYPGEYGKLWFIIPDKFAKSKTNGENMKFLLEDLQINISKILSYKEITKSKSLIKGWE